MSEAGRVGDPQFIGFESLMSSLIAGTLAALLLAGLLTAWQILRCYVLQRWTTVAHLPPLAAFVTTSSVAEGRDATFCVHSTKPYQARLLRFTKRWSATGWTANLPAAPQSPHYHFWNGFDWKPNLTIDAAELSPGLYVLELQQQQVPQSTFRLALIVKPARAVDVAVICSTNTWQAYNAFGGLSNYQDHGTPLPLRWLKRLMVVANMRVRLGDQRYVPAVPLPTARPNSAIDTDLRDPDACPILAASHLVRAESAVVRFLDSEGVDYGVFCDRDLAYDVWSTQCKLLIVAAHSEYWSEEMKGRLVCYLATGGKAVFLSGNNMYRSVEFTEHGIVVRDFREERAPVSRLLGASYNALGFATYAGYQVANCKHWVFDGLGIRNGDSFGEKLASAKVTPVDPIGASGYETDKVSGESRSTHVLAIGKNRVGPAFMVLRETEAGGWVFNAGSVASAPWINEDPIFAALMRNLLKAALQKNSQPESRQSLPAW